MSLVTYQLAEKHVDFLVTVLIEGALAATVILVPALSEQETTRALINILRANENHRKMLLVHRSVKAKLNVRKKTEVGCRYSILLELSYFDPVRKLIIDPMHIFTWEQLGQYFAKSGCSN